MIPVFVFCCYCNKSRSSLTHILDRSQILRVSSPGGPQVSSVTHLTTLRPGCWQGCAACRGLWEKCVQASLWFWLNSVPKVVGLRSHSPMTSRRGCSLPLEAPLLAFFHINPPAVVGCFPSPASGLSALPPATSP